MKPPKKITAKIPDRFGGAAVAVLALTVVLAGLVYWMGFEEFTRVPKIIAIQLGTVLAGLLWAVSARQRPGTVVHPRGLLWLLAFTGWAAASAFWAADQPLAVDTALHWGVCLLAFWLAAQLLSSPAHFRIMLWAMTVAAGVISAIGLLQAWEMLPLVPSTVAPGSTFANRNLAAEAMVFLLPALLLHFALQRQRSSLLAVGFVLALSLAYLVFARSLASWMAVAALTSVFLALLYSRRRLLAGWFGREKIVIALVALGLSALIVVSNRTEDHRLAAIFGAKIAKRAEAVASGLQEAGLQGYSRVEMRPVMYLGALHMIAERPLLGVGLANFGGYFPGSRLADGQQPGKYVDVMRSHFGNAHNDCLQIAAELGLVGPALLAGFLFLWGRSAWVVIRGSESAEMVMIATAAVGLGAGAALNALFSFPLYGPYPVFVLAVTWGAVAAQGGLSRTSTAPPTGLRGVGPVLLLGFGLLVAGRCYLLAVRETAVGRMLDAAKAGDHQQVVEWGNRSLSAWFSNQLALNHLGRAFDELGRPGEALQAVEKFLKHQPFSPNETIFYSYCLSKNGRTAEAIQQARFAAAMAKSSSRAQLQCAHLLEDFGAVEDSLALLQELRTTDGKYNLDYGLAALRAKKLEIAIPALREALASDLSAADRGRLVKILEQLESRSPALR